MFPENLVQACFQQVKTVYKNVSNPRYNASLNDTEEVPYHLVRDVEYTQGMNVLGKAIMLTRLSAHRVFFKYFLKLLT